MPEEISIDTDNRIIVVISRGHISASDLASSRDQIFKINKETGIDKVLVDAREQKTFLKTLESYEASEKLGANPMSRKIKYAILPSVHTRDELRFIETTSVNRGLMVMIHESKARAIEWLKK